MPHRKHWEVTLPGLTPEELAEQEAKAAMFEAFMARRFPDRRSDELADAEYDAIFASRAWQDFALAVWRELKNRLEADRDRLGGERRPS